MTAKQMLGMFCLLFSLTALAHPTDRDGLETVPVGSRLSINKEINALPNQGRVYFKKGVANATDFTPYDTDCFIQLKNADVNDRTIKPTEESLHIAKTYWAYNEHRGWVVLYVESPVISAFVCESRSSVDAVTISQFRRHFGAYVTLEVAPSKPVYP